MQAAEEQAPRRVKAGPAPTLADVSAALQRQLQLRGARPSYLENCESMDRIHLSPLVGTIPVADVSSADIEAVAQRMLSRGLSPKTVRNVLTYVHSVFEYAIERRLVGANPVRGVTRPGRRRQGDVSPDLQFLSIEELEAVIRAIPDDVVIREPASSRKGRSGPAPPPPPDVLGPLLRVLVLTAAMTGLRQSELLGLRWRDVDWSVQRIRVRNAFVRGQHSTDGKSDLSTRRSVPMADRIARELDHWSRRTSYAADEDLVFAHPHTGNPLDRSKVTKRFKAACSAAGVRPVRFHDLRHTFGTRMAASGQPIRSIQEFLGHADVKTTQIYTHYAPSEREVAMVNEAFEPAGNKTGNKLSETDGNSQLEIPADMGVSD
jgi:integrase